MANPVVTAAVLIEANGAALNNSGEPIERAHTYNTVSVKTIYVGGKRYPYVSGQAWRRWWRETLYEDFGWKPSPVTRESKSAYTEGNPVEYADDDMFGYMAAKKRESGSDTQRRVSPLKNSLLISVLPNTVEQDFAHFSRNLPADNSNPVPFEFEHYSTYLQGVFSMSLTDAGRFEIGKMRDLPEGFASDSVAMSEESGCKVARMSPAERKERAAQCIAGLARLRHGANLARNLSDVTPVAVVIGFLDGGNAPFQRLFRATEDRAGVNVDTERFASVLSDYRDRLLGTECPVIYGALPGIVQNEDAVNAVPGVTTVGTAVDAILKAADTLRKAEWLSNVWSL